MIRSKFNESPLKEEKFLELLPLNNTEAVFDDY
jgi:hypothetical protein